MIDALVLFGPSNIYRFGDALFIDPPFKDFMVGSKSYAIRMVSSRVLGYVTITIPFSGLINTYMNKNINLSLGI